MRKRHIAVLAVVLVAFVIVVAFTIVGLQLMRSPNDFGPGVSVSPHITQPSQAGQPPDPGRTTAVPGVPTSVAGGGND